MIPHTTMTKNCAACPEDSVSVGLSEGLEREPMVSVTDFAGQSTVRLSRLDAADLGRELLRLAGYPGRPGGAGPLPPERPAEVPGRSGPHLGGRHGPRQPPRRGPHDPPAGARRLALPGRPIAAGVRADA